MKRHLQRQELKIIEKLKHYETIRQGHRSRRKRRNFKTISLVGYTNAGKSSLLNALTNKDVYIADQLFATLDTRVGKLYIAPEENELKEGKYVPGTEVLISDTIGFIQDLPPSLIQAFKSTLAETIDADLLLHVIDVTDPQMHQKIEVVEEILEQLEIGDKPQIYVFNKIDRIDYKKLLREHLFEQEEEKIYEYHGLIEAGKGVSEMLGWTQEEIEYEELVHDIKKVCKRYKEFDPVFVSAYEKINLESLIDALKTRIKL